MSARLRDIDVESEAFLHLVSLFGPVVAWAESIKSGQKLEANDINVVRILAETGLGFMRDLAKDQGSRGEAARRALEMLEQFRRAFAPKEADLLAVKSPEPTPRTDDNSLKERP